MSDVFISYARSAAKHAEIVTGALRVAGYVVWRDDDLPSQRAYADVIEDQLRLAKAVVVIWSVDAVKSQWVRSEANRAREADKLVQLSIDRSALAPMKFDGPDSKASCPAVGAKDLPRCRNESRCSSRFMAICFA
jgi:adenylate cyclase